MYKRSFFLRNRIYWEYLFLIWGGGYREDNYALSALYDYENFSRSVAVGLQYKESALNITTNYTFYKNYLEDNIISIKLGIGTLAHTEFIKNDSLIADLLFPASTTFFLNPTKTALCFSFGVGYKHTFVYELLQYDIYLIVPNALLSARLSQNLFDTLSLGITIGTYNYFNYPRLIKPSFSFDAKYKCSEQWAVSSELLFRFSSISAQENTQLEYADFRLGVIYAF